MTLDREQLARRGRRLEAFTIGWNCLEGLIAIGAGAVAGSVSLVGFGADSFIEVGSGAAVFWRMAHDADAERREARERLTVRIVGAAFLALAAYVATDAIRDLIGRASPQVSRVGIGLAAVSLLVMPVLSRAKRAVAHALGSRAMRADARQTDFCAYLSAILLGGLLLNALFGLWWADALAGLVMVPIIANEGVRALRGDPCECDH